MMDPRNINIPYTVVNFEDATIAAHFVGKKGEGHPIHVHNYDHITVVHSGSLLVRTPRGNFNMDRSSGAIRFPANEWHELEALEDGTSFSNIYAKGKDGFEPITIRDIVKE